MCSPFSYLRQLHWQTPAGVIVLLLSAMLPANAQGVGSSRGLSSGEGSNMIQGRVFFPPGESVTGKVVRLHLESNETTGTPSAVTDQDGAFRFNALAPGNYTVVVDGGKEYESSREAVVIDLNSRGRIVQVTIQLRAKVDSSNPAFAGVPQSALDAYQKGTAAAQKGNSKDAAQFLSKAVSISPTFAPALSDLGAQYIRLSQWEKAAETFEALLKLKPNDAPAHLDMGMVAYNQGMSLLNENKLDEAGQKMALAESHLRESLKLKSTGPSAHYYLGLTLLKLKRYDEAQAEMEATIKNGGENIALAHRTLGGLYMSQHRNKEAADELEKYLKLDPKARDADKIKESVKQLRSQ
jgi:tetratricopeptide (TPR) repeat protein